MTYVGNCRLGDLFESRRERGRPGLPLLSVTMNDGLVDRDDLERKQDTSLSPKEHLLVEPGDIAYNTMRMWQGAFGLADREGMVSPAYVVLRAKENADPAYLAQLLQMPRMRYLLRAYSYGLTDDRLRLYFADFAAIPAHVPGLDQQRHIAKILDAWDQSIRVAELLLASRKLLRRALSERMLVRPMAALAHPQQGLPHPPGWKRGMLGQISRITSGGTPDRGDETLWGGSVPWVTTGEIQFNTIRDTAERITEEGLRRSAAKVFPPGTLLMAMYGQGRTRGQVAKLGVEAATNQACAAILLHEGYDSEFYFQYLSAQYEAIRELGNAGTQQNLNGAILKSLLVPIPPASEQRRIVRVLSAVDHAIRLSADQVRLLNEEKAALMAELLTGKRRVRFSAAETTP